MLLVLSALKDYSNRPNMEPFKQGIRNIYDGGHDWKRSADWHFTPKVAAGLYKDLVAADVIPAPEKDFVFVSTSANIPTHEMVFFDEDRARRTAFSLFLVGDISEIPMRVGYKRKERGKASFHYVLWDAEKLPLPNDFADTIFDRKGCLWYAARDLSLERFLGVIAEYERVLKPGGSIILDYSPEYRKMQARTSIPERQRIDEKFRQLQAGVSPITVGQTFTDPNATDFDYSTVDMIQHHKIKPGSPEEKEIQKRFSDKIVSQGLSRVLVMTKRKIDN